MKVQLNTDNHIQGDQSLALHVQGIVEASLARFSGQITRVEVHLSDMNAGKTSPSDKHCTMEARLEGRQPQAVSDTADNLHAAINGAAHKLQRALESSLGKLAH